MTEKLTQILHQATAMYLADLLLKSPTKDHDTAPLIDLVMNAHLNSMFRWMNQLAEDVNPPNPHMKETVSNVIADIIKFLKDHPILKSE